jgi:hypothetical protein
MLNDYKVSIPSRTAASFSGFNVRLGKSVYNQEIRLGVIGRPLRPAQGSVGSHGAFPAGNGSRLSRFPKKMGSEQRTDGRSSHGSWKRRLGSNHTNHNNRMVQFASVFSSRSANWAASLGQRRAGWSRMKNRREIPALTPAQQGGLKNGDGDGASASCAHRDVFCTRAGSRTARTDTSCSAGGTCTAARNSNLKCRNRDTTEGNSTCKRGGGDSLRRNNPDCGNRGTHCRPYLPLLSPAWRGSGPRCPPRRLASISTVTN